MKNFRQLTSIVLLLGFTLIFPVSFAEVPVGISINLEVAKKKIKRNDGVILQTTFTNTTKKPIQLLKWNTPLEGEFLANIFDVKQANGRPATYIGKLVKRHPPTESDYVTLVAGESISASLDLSDAYAISDIGHYSAQYRVNRKLQKKRAFKKKLVSFEITEQRQTQWIRQSRPTNYTACSTQRISTLNNVMTEASNITNNAVTALTSTAVSHRPTALRYTTWFGSYTSSRYATATTHFNSIKDALDNQQITLHCDCTFSFFAYVIPNDPYNIHLCNKFWTASITGTDSQAGTIIHELSHFTAVAGTDDHIYGQPGAQSLADKNPISALDSADNHEYFAENTPFLPMNGSTVPTGDTYEPDDNTSAGANVITANITQRHSIVPGNDQDWGKIIVRNESLLTLTTSGNAGDTILTLYNANNEQIAKNDDSGSYFSRIEISLAPGTYYARVTSYKSSKVPSYNLDLTLESNSTLNIIPTLQLLLLD